MLLFVMRSVSFFGWLVWLVGWFGLVSVVILDEVNMRVDVIVFAEICHLLRLIVCDRFRRVDCADSVAGWEPPFQVVQYIVH